MLLLIAAGVIPEDLGSGDPSASVGIATAPPPRTVVLARSDSVYSYGESLDPADRVEFAQDWTAMLNDGEAIDSIQSVTIGAVGVSLGFMVDDGAERLPLIDLDANKTQFWALVDSAQQANPAFAAVGIQVGVTLLIRTNSDPYRELERTSFITVKQQ